jgi:hypothetical protein
MELTWLTARSLRKKRANACRISLEREGSKERAPERARGGKRGQTRGFDSAEKVPRASGG